MEYNINLYNVLLGFGMFQSFIFGGLLFFKSRFNQAHKFLGITVIFLSFYIFWVLKYDFGFQKIIPWLRFLPVLFLWGIGPAFYTYLRLLFDKLIPKKQLKYHFFPLVLELLNFNVCTVIYLTNGGDKAGLSALELGMLHNLFSVEHIIGLISIGVYLLLSLKLIYDESIQGISFRLKLIVLSFALLWSIWVPYTVYDIIYYNFAFPPSGFYVFYLLFATLTYCIGFFGFKLNASIEKGSFPELIKQTLVVPNTEEIKEAERIKSLMIKERYFLKPDLNIKDFSNYVNLHPNKTSAIINSALGVSFRDFVNSYRVEEFKKQVDTYNLEERTILSLAFEVGFNSKASFNRVFKKTTGLSPIEYVTSMKKS